MLPKAARLTAPEVRAILKSGRALRGSGSALRYRAGSPAKAAVVVSKKVAKTAVMRNKLRRLGYRALTPLPRGTQLVLFIQNQAVTPADIAALCSPLF